MQHVHKQLLFFRLRHYPSGKDSRLAALQKRLPTPVPQHSVTAAKEIRVLIDSSECRHPTGTASRSIHASHFGQCEPRAGQRRRSECGHQRAKPGRRADQPERRPARPDDAAKRRIGRRVQRCGCAPEPASRAAAPNRGSFPPERNGHYGHVHRASSACTGTCGHARTAQGHIFAAACAPEGTRHAQQSWRVRTLHGRARAPAAHTAMPLPNTERLLHRRHRFPGHYPSKSMPQEQKPLIF